METDINSTAEVPKKEEVPKISLEKKLENDKKVVAYLKKTGIDAHLPSLENEKGKHSYIIDYWKQWKMPVDVETAYVETIPRELPAIKTEADAVMYALEPFGWSQTFVIKKSAIDAFIEAKKESFSIDDVPCEDYFYLNLLKAKVMELPQ